ncbi:MAG: sulfite exporter TauE/SafE family protein, partial [Gammaproteobacteria bacterium]|nr:sulfite exporter TauE/SafE family protein [Gammaproteobacteria bacterium]
FNLGLFSTLHCLGMCGGIISALSLSIPDRAGVDIKNKAKFVVAYNFGRISSYTLAGAIAGFVGEHVVTAIMPESGHRILQVAAAIVLVLIGLHLAGWLPKFTKIEFLGFKLWQLVQPVLRRLIPVTGLPQALLAGVIWGWLPCALVYSMLLWSLTGGSAYAGALLMFAFGLGTFPSMITAGVLGSRLFDILKQRTIRNLAGVIIIFLGIASPFFYSGHHVHHQSHILSGK